jgi:hypothetical protein
MLQAPDAIATSITASMIAAPLLQAYRCTALQGAFLSIAAQQHNDAIVLHHFVMTTCVAIFVAIPQPYVYFVF